MKKLVKLTSILGATVLGLTTAGVGVVNAAEVTDGVTGSTTATVGLETDPDAKVQLTNAPVLDFGTQDIGGEKLTIPLVSADDALRVVNPGLLSGWNVNVKGTTFTDASTSKTLEGATLILNGIVSSEDANNTSTAPSTKTALEVNEADAPVFTAASEAGVGNWLNKFDTSDSLATLNIPAGNSAGKYVSNLTWTLADAPA